MVFSGNPAAVCLLNDKRDAPWIQSVATEKNPSETAFVRQLAEGFELRWFTPAVEVDLCGHATLHRRMRLGSPAWLDPTMRLASTASRNGELIELDFPATPAEEVQSS